MKKINLYLGKCEEVLKQLEDNSIDLIVTDPPYGYSFMSKDWDKVVIPSSTWKECLRVLKPGAFAFIMSAPRQDVLSKMIVNLSEAGFETGFSSIYWTYASGFPKASNIGKMADKRLGNKRKIIGKGKGHTGEQVEKHLGVHDDDNYEWQGKFDITKGNSPLEGSYAGFQPKPAIEIIITVMKPLSEKTYVDQALKNGKGITWLNKCKIPYDSDDDKSQATPQGKCTSKDVHTGAEPDAGNNENRTKFERPEQKGRFPANLLISDDSLNDGKISKSGKDNIRKKKLNSEIYGGGKGLEFSPNHKEEISYPDSGSYSRYFDLDKWWKEKVKELPLEVQKVFPFLICPKASKSEKNKGCKDLTVKKMEYETTTRTNKETADKFGCERKSKAQNIHPTVKPIKLMSYLVTLGSKENDIILDPFAGSCTTGIACKLLNRKFIGIEINKEYLDIGMARIKGWSEEENKK